MLAMPPKDRVSSTAVQHSDGVSTTHIRRVNHHAEIPRESYVDFTTLEPTSTAACTRHYTFVPFSFPVAPVAGPTASGAHFHVRDNRVAITIRSFGHLDPR
jgi:hypothetical protein